MLDVKGISVSYGGIAALREATLSVRQGELVALIGTNGAGKTTMLKTVSGLLRPQTGEIRLAGQNVTPLPAHRRARLGVCHVVEGGRSFTSLTVLENLRLGAAGRRVSTPDLERDIEETFTLFPVLGERRTQRAGTLSGGERQMLAIARGLMARPKLLLLDEPSQGLAPKIIDVIFDALVSLNRSQLAVLLVEQNAVLALDVAQRAYVLDVGRIVLEGPSEELRANRRVEELYLGIA